MCRRPVALALAALLGATAALAQGARGGSARARALLARAESLQAGIARQDSAERRRRYDELRAERFDAGDVTVLLPRMAGEVAGQRIAGGAAQYLDSAGAVPASFVASQVAIAYEAVAVDSVLRTEKLTGRTRIWVDIPAQPDSSDRGWIVAARITRGYVESLDPEWRSWAPQDLGLGFMHGRDDVAAMRELTAGDTRTSIECLGSSPAGCRLWLGLDRTADPYGARYTPAEIRVLVSRRMVEYLPGDARQCVNGSDEACMRFARSGGVPPVPAGAASTRSVLRAVRVLHGAPALRRALADTSGSIGQRLARASGISEDSLVTEWRAWLLTGGSQRHVAAGVLDALPVIVFGGLLLLAAAGTGRWR